MTKNKKPQIGQNQSTPNWAKVMDARPGHTVSKQHTAQCSSAVWTALPECVLWSNLTAYLILRADSQTVI